MVLAGCSSASAQGHSSAPSLHNGIYVGAQGAPEYFVVLTSGPHGAVTGSLQYLYGDGQTAVIVAFSGTAQAGVATLMPSAVPSVPSVGAHEVPSAFSATYGDGRLNLGSCDTYLPISQITSLAGCTFLFSAHGLA